MISAIQTVPNIAAFSALPNLGRISYLPQAADSSLPNPGVILTLGTGLPLPLTYTAAGQFETLVQGTGTAYTATGPDAMTTASVFNAMNILPAVASDSTGISLINPLSADHVLTGMPSAPTAAAATARSPISAPAIAAATEDASGTAAAASNLASSLLADDAAQTLAKIAADPSYANMAAALYLSAAMFRSQHAADVALPNTSRSIQPVKELRAVYPV